jgi:hypothetical protein
VQLRNFDIVDDKIKGKTEELVRDLTIDPRCFEFGQHAVVMNPILFRQRVRQVLRGNGHVFQTGSVKYYDEMTFHGPIPDAEIPFRKQKRFDFQREYRVAIHPRVMTLLPITINLGDISSFCKKTKASEINTLWSLAPAA